MSVAAAITSLLMLQTPAAISAETEACLRENAVAVERASDTLTEAVDFLTTYICATTVSRDANAAHDAAYAEMVTRLPRSHGIPVSIELPSDEGEYAEAIGPRDGAPSEDEMGENDVTWVGPFMPWTDYGTLSPVDIPVTVRETAARYVLDARLARLEREGGE